LADKKQVLLIFQKHADYHRECLKHFEKVLDRLEQQHKISELSIDSPLFGNHCTLKRAIGYEREYAEWCEWVSQQLLGRGEQSN
jgi:hypothetical protein